MAFVLLSRPKKHATAVSSIPIRKRKAAPGWRAVDSRLGFEKSASPFHVASLPMAPVIQAKLKIGELNEKYEQEADRVADEVMRLPKLKMQRRAPVTESISSNEHLQTTRVQASKAGEISVPPIVYRPAPPALSRQPRLSAWRGVGPMVTPDRDGQPEEDEDIGLPLAPGMTTRASGLAALSVPRPSTCPTHASMDRVRAFNHASLPAAERANWRTYLGAVTRMNLHPGPDHRAHCMQERLSLIANDCPESLTRRTRPCSATACLPVGRGGQDQPTGIRLSAGRTSFLDRHISQSESVSFLEGTGVDQCSYTCLQRYRCDSQSGARVAGDFLVTRFFRADTYTPPGGTPMHITTGTVTKVGPKPPPVPGDYPQRILPEGVEYA